MFSSKRELKWLVVSAGLTLVLVTSFQNCAPSLPDNDVRQLGGASVRPTPLPAATPPPQIGDTVYGGLPWEGTCTNDFAVENMAVPGLDVPYSPLVVYTRASDGAAALWNFNVQAVNRGVVCKMNSTGWSLKATGDFSGDGQTDVLWRNTDGKVAVWILNGSGRIGGGFSNNQTSAWYLEGTKDFDGDGKADIFWRNPTTDQLQIWFMDGATVKSAQQVALQQDNWKILGFGDFDGDRKGDILWRDQNDQRLRIWFMNGASIRDNKAPSQEFATGYTYLGIGDFDGDAKTDLVWKNSSNAMVIWKMVSEVRTEQVLAAADASWTFEFTVDANLDARAEWIWSIPNPNTGLPGLGITRNVATNAPATSVYNPIRAGWTTFKFSQF